MRDLLEPTLHSWGIHLTDAQYRQCAHYADALLRWNETTNLTAITDPQGVAVRHFLDSFACARAWTTPPATLCDIGSGAGFPGLPLKILWPDTEVVLVESTGKKVAFLDHIVASLGLQKVETSTSRAELLGQDKRHREYYEAVVARAVAALPVLSELCLPLVAMGGRFVAPKSADGAVEAASARRAIAQLGGRVAAIMPVQLPGLDPRTLVVVAKIRPTPAQFPRAVGVPGKRPL